MKKDYPKSSFKTSKAAMLPWKGIFSSIFFLLLSTVFSHAETLTLTTYYPAPFGAYDTLRLIPRASVPAACSGAITGGLYIDSGSTLQICRDLGGGNYAWSPLTGVWAQNGNNIYPTDTATNPNIRVGIGNSTPQVRLDIRGGALQWGNNNSLLSNDQGGSIELGGNNATAGTGIPYIDFHFGPLGAQDFNTRIINDANGRLSINAGTTHVSGNLGVGNASPGYRFVANGDIFANGGWMRVAGNQGLFFEDHGGGWRMTDNTWIRSYGGKPVYMNNGFDTGSPSGVNCGGALGSGLYNFQVCGSAGIDIIYDRNNTGFYVDMDNTSNLNLVTATSYGINGGASLYWSAYGISWQARPGWINANGASIQADGDVCSNRKCLNSVTSQGAFNQANCVLVDINPVGGTNFCPLGYYVAGFKNNPHNNWALDMFYCCEVQGWL